MHIFMGNHMSHYEVAMLAFGDMKQRERMFVGPLATMGIG